MLTYRRIKKTEREYAVQLARDEIDIEPKRLGEYKTYLIFHEGERVGYVSFGLEPDKTIYIYILVFEKDAQRQGFASTVFESLLEYGREKVEGFRGLSATVHKINHAAVNAAKKNGFQEVKERSRYIDFLRPIS